MEEYPFVFIIVMTILFSMQTFAGVGCNLVILINWYWDRQRKTLAKGNHFVTLLKVLDLVIATTAVPLMVAVLLVKPAENLVVCFLKEGAVMFASSASSLCVLMISVDRYTAVVMPTTTTFTRGKVILCRCLVILVATIGFILPCLSLLMGKSEQGQLESVHILPCRNVLWTFQPYYIYDVYDVIIFIITVIIIIICYRAVLKVARTRRRTFTVFKRSRTPRDSLITNTNAAALEVAERSRRQDSKATKMTSLIVASFLVCWGPHVVVSVIEFALPRSLVVAMIQDVVLFFAFMAPILHPLIYTYETQGWRRTNRVRDVHLAMGLPGIRVVLNESENTLHLDNHLQQSSGGSKNENA